MDETSRIKWAKIKGNALMKLSALKEWILNMRNLEISWLVQEKRQKRHKHLRLCKKQLAHYKPFPFYLNVMGIY